ncbi:hypothetical protein [Natrialba sp. PRR66]|uniref:LVIVD repeat-containing protein n=1 Tax=Natrialba sp. PRR66 TaxID=3098146 RepID=UPI002B1D9AAA|nr:hypothetical protein [Natrialba sp. PRR66]
MRRRSFLRTGLTAGAALSVSATAATGAPAATQDSTSNVSSTPQDATPSSYEPLGRVEIDRAAETVVGDDGDIAYVATTTGFATVDVSDPADPTVLAREGGITVDGTPLIEILDVEVDGNRLVVPGPANPTSEEVFHGFCCYDVSDPADPTPAIEPYETGFHIHNCYLEGDRLFVVSNGSPPAANELVIFDLGDDTVTERGRWALLDYDSTWEDLYWLARYVHDVYVQDDIAYLPFWNAGTYLVDVSDPDAPAYVSHVVDPELDRDEQRTLDDETAQFSLPGNDHYAAVDDTGDLMAVGREAWATGSDDPDGAGGIDLYDISDPTTPTHQASIDAPAADDESYRGGTWTTAHNFELRNGRLYSAWYQGGVKIHDVSDPADPTELAAWRDAETTGFWTARILDPETAFVASSTDVIPKAGTTGELVTFPTDPDSGDTESGSDDGGAIGESIPGFTGAAGAMGLAGGMVGAAWLRRRLRS